MTPDQVRVLKIEGHVNILVGYLELCESYDCYINNEPVSAASVLHLLQIGELATGLSDDFRLQHKCIPWKSIIGLRNIIAHRYGNLNYTRIWDILTNEIPSLSKWLKAKSDW